MTISDLYEEADNQLLLAEESLSAANYEWEEIGRLIELNRDNFFQTEQPHPQIFLWQGGMRVAPSISSRSQREHHPPTAT